MHLSPTALPTPSAPKLALAHLPWTKLSSKLVALATEYDEGEKLHEGLLAMAAISQASGMVELMRPCFRSCPRCAPKGCCPSQAVLEPELDHVGVSQEKAIAEDEKLTERAVVVIGASHNCTPTAIFTPEVGARQLHVRRPIIAR